MPSFDGSALEPATLTYKLTRSRSGNTSAGTITTTLSTASYEGQPAWRVVNESTKGPGDSRLVLHLDRSTLYPLALGSGETFDLTYDGTTVTGTVRQGQHATSIDTTVGGPVLDEKSPNLNVALASLSLEVGQSFAVRTFSPLEPAVHVATVEVTGTETVDVPAGAFETYVVSVSSVRGQVSTTGTMHLRAAAPHYLIEGETTIETAGGLSMTATRTLQTLEEDN